MIIKTTQEIINTIIDVSEFLKTNLWGIKIMIILGIITTVLSITSAVISITMFYKTRKLNNKFKVWKNLKGNDFDLQIICG